MLVLTRKRNEEILIDDGRIKVTVVKVQGQKVRIGVEAPQEVSVQRREVAERMKREAQCDWR